MLRCLTDKLEQVQEESCKKEVSYFEKMEVSNFRNDIILAEACRDDVDKFCTDVEAGACSVPAPSANPTTWCWECRNCTTKPESCQWFLPFI